MTESGATTTDSDSSGFRSLTVGQLGMWLFISTEIMLFVAMAATYLILRLSTLGTGWPAPSNMHMSITTGIINTVILIVSGVTAWAMYHAASDDRPKTARLWLLITLALGFVFLGIKSSEYYEKYRIGLMPVPGQKQIHDEANPFYLSQVNQRLKDEISKLESRSAVLAEQKQSLSEEEEQRLELVYSLKQFMTDVTSDTVGKGESGYHGHLAMKLMAWQIFRHPDTSRNVEEILEPELKVLGFQLSAGTQRLDLVQERQTLVQQQIKDLTREIEQLTLLDSTGNEGSELQARKNWLEVKRTQDQKLTVEKNRMESKIAPIQGRIDNLMATFGGDEEILGINDKHGLRLPVVVPNGQPWMNIYLLLTGTHAIHLIAGLIVLLGWLPRKLSSEKSHALYVTCMYWQFVDVIWLCIFWFIYI